MRWIVRAAWSALAPIVKEWLVSRALKLPLKDQARWAKQLDCTVGELAIYNAWLAEQAAARLDEIKP
jgi:hypothetical protein